LTEIDLGKVNQSFWGKLAFNKNLVHQTLSPDVKEVKKKESDNYNRDFNCSKKGKRNY